jgi:hypothetical protein
MKTFEDLVFKAHPIGNGLQAVEEFKNEYGVSVIKFAGSYGYASDLWEVAILYDGDITYNTYITDDVLGHQTEDQVNDIMKRVQQL